MAEARQLLTVPSSERPQSKRTKIEDAHIEMHALKGSDAFKGRALEMIQESHKAIQENKPFDGPRPCRDVIWAILFLGTVVSVLGVAFLHAKCIFSLSCTLPGNGQPLFSFIVNNSKEELVQAGKVVSTAIALGGLFAVLAAYSYMKFAVKCTGCIVYTALYGTSFFLTLGGVGIILLGLTLPTDSTEVIILGGVTSGAGVLAALLITCCWGRYIQFTILMVETVADIISRHPGMIPLAIASALLSIVWVVIVFTAFFGLLLSHQLEVSTDTPAWQVYSIVFGLALVVYWGIRVIHNELHMTFCGVVGRWYFAPEAKAIRAQESDGEGASLLPAEATQEEPNTIAPSLRVALTTSFGSVCCGSLVAALLDAALTVFKVMEEQAKGEGNMVGRCIAVCLECVVGCIATAVEYMNEWAYVQCAMRGVSFCEAAKITFSMCTCANIPFIVGSLLMDCVVHTGSLFCTLSGSLAGAGTAFIFMDPDEEDFGAVCVLTMGVGAACGSVTGHTTMALFGSGIKTILACWAEDEEPLHKTHPDVHRSLCETIDGKIEVPAPAP